MDKQWMSLTAPWCAERGGWESVAPGGEAQEAAPSPETAARLSPHAASFSAHALYKT